MKIYIDLLLSTVLLHMNNQWPGKLMCKGGLIEGNNETTANLFRR